MKKLLTMLFLAAWALSASANDGVFYAAGNQLIPIVETDISVKREVLNIVRQGDYAIIDVHYEFFNPTKAKTLLVGFEAPTPYNATFNFSDYHDSHPFISDFTVIMNGKDLPYKVALVGNDSIYYKNGKFIYADTLEEKESIEHYSGSLFGQYVYHFTAKFQPGVNTIHHKYKYKVSTNIAFPIQIFYTLTAANRWANHQIDDFTLNIDMSGSDGLMSFQIPATFFERADEWHLTGQGHIEEDLTIDPWDSTKRYAIFHTYSNGASFHKKNFHPNGELTVEHRTCIFDLLGEVNKPGRLNLALQNYAAKQYHYQLENLPQMLEDWSEDPKDAKKLHQRCSDFTRKIMRNLPWAYRGYVFTDKKLQKFFESTQWYIANPAYKGSQEDFSKGDKKWVKYWDMDENAEIIE
ncbi:MAG: YARHG domain-containing protein [Bacteroidales bacterium]|nr:YARHG domain-containing protein [Bacteroidales bacterium]